MVTNSAVIPFLVIFSVNCVTPIRVPSDWNSDSDVTEKLINEAATENKTPVPIPVEYFQYHDKKPKFAVEIAAYHGVKNPENHYTSYPIRPYTGQQKPELGKHKILDQNNPVFQQFQQYTQINDGDKIITPTSSNYEVFHPYEAEEPALQEIYKDPVLDKIRNDIYNTQNRLQEYEKDSGKPDIQEGEYLESPEQTDRKKFPQRNIPVRYERHRPQRRPIYYRPGPNFNREHILNQKFRHPWNQHNAKIRPVHYRPLKNHIHRLRQQHAVKFDDEHNEYPQIPAPEQYAEIPDGYDIYQRGKAKYVALRNNVDESINNAVKENRPVIHQKLELQNNGDKSASEIRDLEEPEFVPIKNYAQVRKTETTKHLPRKAALEDAASFDEIRNAPRLREAVKSTKAQTVYSEEGYEDAAYDHAGEEKHAAENEGHGGFLKEKEKSGGKYKAPELSGKYQDASGSEYKDQTLHGEKWNNDDKNKEEEAEEDDYTEDDIAQSVEADVYDEVNGDRNKRQNESGEKNVTGDTEGEDISDEEEGKYEETAVERSKRENKLENDTLIIEDSNKFNDSNLHHELNKHETKDEENRFKVPILDFNSTFLTAEELFKLAKLKEKSTPKKESIKEKYPYYFQNLKNLPRNSPLRYSENLKLIPRKSKGGTEFYDSRSVYECPEVDDDIDPVPEKVKQEDNLESKESDEIDEDDNEEDKKKGEADFSQLKKKRRLKGLGDKIDCFKSKYFGENPLDSPFFKEEIISNPEPIIAPKLPSYKLLLKEPVLQASNLNNVFNISDKLKENAKSDIFLLFDDLKGKQDELQDSLVQTNEHLRASLARNNSNHNNADSLQKTHFYTDVLDNIKNNGQSLFSGISVLSNQTVLPKINTTKDSNLSYISYKNKEDATQLPLSRKKRSAPFNYEPYKIIRDGQVPESKKTTTTSNISPLIKKLQTSRVVDRVAKSIQDKEPVKRNSANRNYKDIGRKEREKNSMPTLDSSEAKFIDVNVDQRRGEPRYEIRLPNHKVEYTPVKNKKAMSVEDYEAQTNKTIRKPEVRVDFQSEEVTTVSVPLQSIRSISQKRPLAARSFFDVSQYVPKASDMQKTSASNSVKKVVKSPVDNKKSSSASSDSDDSEDDEEYEEYDEDEEPSTTTSTTLKPSFRKRRPTSKTTTTTEKPEEEEPEYPKLRLITRFRSTVAPITTEKEEQTTRRPVIKQDDDSELSPKYREKKKKSSKSTVVTDTKTYGNDDGDMMEDEVDAMIGVQQDMEQYKPRYEKEVEESQGGKETVSSTSEEDEDDSEEDEDAEDNDDSEEIESDESDSEEDPPSTTPEPTKSTLVRTTVAPISTTESRYVKQEQRPIIHKKKIEIHKEIPMNKSSPHLTEFRQDIKEIEIIKEMPPNPKLQRIRKPQKNLEALDLHKDENLAKDINKLEAVEVFKQNLDLRKGPKHGGNYRSAQLMDLQKENKLVTTSKPTRFKAMEIKKDTDTSQSKNAKLVELTEVLPARRFKARNRNIGRSSKLEIDDTTEMPRKLHGGNLKSVQDKEGRRGRHNHKSAKLIELDDENDSEENSSQEAHGGNFKNYGNTRSSGRSLHGGNYRSAKLLHKEDTETTTPKVRGETINTRNGAAGLLNSFAQVVPILTSTPPPYILDPSKRMYYYVDDK